MKERAVHENVTQGVINTARSSTDEKSADSVNMAVMVDRMIQVTRRQKSGPTAGKKSNHSGKEPTAGEKSKANSRQHELELGEVVTTIPMTDFNVENVEYKNLSFIVQKDTEMIH